MGKLPPPPPPEINDSDDNGLLLPPVSLTPCLLTALDNFDEEDFDFDEDHQEVGAEEEEEEEGYGYEENENEEEFLPADVEETDEPVIFDYDKSSSMGETLMLQKTVDLVSAHKLAIAEMVEVSATHTTHCNSSPTHFLVSSGHEGGDGTGADDGAGCPQRHSFLRLSDGPDTSGQARVNQCLENGIEILSEVSHGGPLYSCCCRRRSRGLQLGE
jgi:hypothetical protein